MATIINKSRHKAKKNGVYGSKMASRNLEVRAVGAWVQPEPFAGVFVEDAVASAQAEEARQAQQQQEKAAKLQRFQEDVRHRVKQLQNLKLQQQLHNSYKAVEVERNVVHQSAFAAEQATPRKNRCSVRPEKELSITSQLSSSEGSTSQKSPKGTDEYPTFENHTNKVHSCNRQARRKLTSRQVITEHFQHDDLPGGVWKSGPTLDHPASRQNNEGYILQGENGHFEGEPSEGEDSDAGVDPVRVVQFEPEPHTESSRRDRIARKSAAHLLGSQVERVPQVPVIHPGVVSEEERLRAQSQRAMYRRLFMDIEREQVKENMRRKQHRKQIHQLKKAAEAERQRVEDLAQQIIEPTDPVTGETAEESLRRERQEEEEMLQLSLQQDRERRQRGRETERFLEALKQNLREKIEKQDIELPPMCCCADTVWDTNPDTCANNCVFYKNPKGYARALQSLLASCDVV